MLDIVHLEGTLSLRQNRSPVMDARYRMVFETSQDGIIIIRFSDRKILNANRSSLDLFGYELDELIGQDALKVDIWANQGAHRLYDSLFQAGHAFKDVETTFTLKGGEKIWGLLSASKEEIDGETYVLSFQKNISKRKIAEEAMSESEMRYRSIFQVSPDGVSITQMESGLFLDVNQSFLDIYGYEKDEVVGKSCKELGLWDDLSDRVKLVGRIKKYGRSDNLECLSKRKNGEEIWISITSSAIEINGVPCILNYRKDITDRKIAERNIHNLAFYDQLTGLPNRASLNERVSEMLTVCQKENLYSALLHIDLDDFKTFNETLGHSIGDILLQQVAERLSSCVGEGDLVSRFGGDEFAVVLGGAHGDAPSLIKHAEHVAKKILAALEQGLAVNDRRLRITGSVGVTLLSPNDTDSNIILKRADLAMYSVKDNGRNNFCFFESEMESAVLKRAKLDSDLRDAIASDQFELYFQCQVAANKVIGAEALVRWNDPVRGVIPPLEFIPFAEESKLIIPLGQLILKKACQQLAKWASIPHRSHLTIAVNVSVAQFQEADFVKQVLDIVAHTGANPNRLKLELTENLLVADLNSLAEKMFALKAKGIGFSLDDFGTGYSSLSYLKSLPLQQLKIDKNFVRDVLFDPHHAVIVQTIIALAQNLGMGVIAEGVETIEQRNFLAEAGCHAYQGFLFSKPCGINDFEHAISRVRM